MTKHHFPTQAALSIAFALALLPARCAFAVNKDMVELQTQIQGLQDAVARLQQSNDERMGVLRDLVQQTADSVNKMSVTVDGLQRRIQAQGDASGGKVDQVSGQVTAVSDSVDEIKARLSKLEKTLQDLQGQQQSINATLQNMNPGGAGAAPLPAPAPMESNPPAQTAPALSKRGKPSAGMPMASTAPAPDVATVSTTPAAPPASDLYKTALSDYMAAKYPLASSEFNSVSRNYPDDPLAGNAFYYMGEIDYRTGRFAVAVKDYDHVLDSFPDNPKVPVSYLHKGMALFAMKQNDAGVRELRTLINKYPNSTEATQARSKLNGMGVPIVPRR